MITHEPAATATWKERWAEEAKDKTNVLWSIGAGDETVGYVRVRFDGAPNAEIIGIQQLVIDPAHERKGYGWDAALALHRWAFDFMDLRIVATDQRGIARPFDDPAITNATGGDGCDIGAFEIAAPPAPEIATGAAVSVWLLLRAFASGCTAMTGVEAVSNGVSAFRAPAVTHAHRTLTAIVVILAVLLAGIAYLAGTYHTLAMDQSQPGYQSILSQLTGAVVGRGGFYFVAMGSVLAVLCLSANTSFAGFPRLCRQVARDEYLPRAFAIPGRRLVNSVGIIWLAVTAGALLVIFDGITDRLIPLFAVGAFLSFTLSQAGMAVHWARQPRDDRGRRRGHHARLAINAAGAVATGASLAVILVTKFAEGAWITVLTIPCVLALLKLTKRYYAQIDRQLMEEGPIALDDVTPPIVIVPIGEWNRLAERALCYALRLSSEVIALHLTRLEGPDAEEDAEQLRRRWRRDVERPARAAGLKPPRLVQIPSPYRSIVAPLLKFVLELREKSPQRALTVVIPALVEAHWWDHLMHTRRVHRLRETLLRHGGPRLAVVLVPWTLEEPHPEAVIAAEEPPRKLARHPEPHAAK